MNKFTITLSSLLLFCISESKAQTERVSIPTKQWEAQGIFYGKQPEQEILSARTAYTKKFLRGNGIIDIYFGGPFHYQDQQGAWQDINLDILSGNGLFSYVNKENEFLSSFATLAKDGVQMQYKNSTINFGMNTIVSAGNWMPEISNHPTTNVNQNILSYQDIYKDINLEYEVTTDALLHRMQFNNKNIFNSLSQQAFIEIEETVELPFNASVADNSGVVTLNRKLNGNLYVILNRDTLYTIHASHVWDGAYNGNILELNDNDALPSGITGVDTRVVFLSTNTIKLIATVPVNWLKAPERIYPIVFDPTVGVGNQSSFSSGYRYPFNTCRQQRISQILFLKNDINAGGINTTGTITQIEFLQNTNNPIANNNVQVKMQEVPWNVMTTSTLTTSGFTNVYGPSTQNYTSGGTNTWRSLSLSTPFSYTNTNNLLVEVSFNNAPNNTSGCSCTNTAPGGHWGWYNSPYAGHRWAYSMSAATPPSGGDCNYSNSPEGNPAYGYFIPATRITINTTGGCVPISFSNQPVSQSVVAPAQAQFSVLVAGTTPTYQWQISTNGGSTWNNVPAGAPYSGITTNQLTINPTTIAMNGYRYHCVADNSCTNPPVNSSTAVLTVNAAGCSAVLTPTASAPIAATGGSGSFAINVTPNTCSWSATETISWVTITSPLSGTGDGILNYTAAANTGSTRSGIISVNGQNYTVNQLGAAAPTTYTISGRVIENGSPGLAGVTISTSPSAGTTITDAQGYYTLNVPLTYTGTVTPTLAPFTFTPASRTVSPTNFSNKDFDAIGVSITILPSSIIAPWQREGDDYGARIKVSLNSTTTSWHIQADVYNVNGVLTKVIFPSTTLLSDTLNTFWAAPTQNQTLKNLSKNGSRVEYIAVFDANPSLTDTLRSTMIIEKKWDNKNYVFYNSGGGQILIPLRYFPNCISATINFSRVANVSNATNKITSVPIVQLGNQKFFVLNNVNSLIRDVSPGVFNYTISYNPSGFYQESGTFDLTKIGRVHNSNASSNTIVVLVGGIRNNIEQDIFDLSSTYNSQSNDSWSVANDLSLHYGINTWYIAQSNMNSTQKNAYDLGIGLEEIRKQCISSGTTFPSISVIAHSKGGLEMRVMLDNKGAPASSTPLFTFSPLNPFTNNTISGSLKALIFLGTPHHGSNFGYAVANTPGGQDLLPNSDLIAYLNAGTNVPNIRLANITGYQISALGNVLVDVIGDGLVTLESSSQGINISGQSIFRQFYLAEDYDPFGLENYLDYLLHTPNIVDNLGHLNALLDFIYRFSFHSKLHRSYRLNNPQNSCPSYSSIPIGPGPFCQLSVSSGTTSMMSKILSVINNSNIPSNCMSPGDISCFASGHTWASVLANTMIYKVSGVGQQQFITRSDENGHFNLRFNDSLKLGDQLIFSAPGIDSMMLPLDSIRMFGVEKFPMAFFKSSQPTSKIKYPKILLPNQELITNSSILPIKISCINTISYDIFSNHDISFRPLTFTDTTVGIALDSGLNVVAVRFNGIIDSVVLVKTIYYLPGASFTAGTYKVNVIANNSTIGAETYLNEIYYRKINTTTALLPLLFGKNHFDFYRFGYRKYSVDVNGPISIDLTQMQPFSYSSLGDSVVFNYTKNVNPQYWRTITLKNLSIYNNVKISAKQFDDSFTGMSLKPQTRKFVFRRINSRDAAYYKTAIALDQINTPDKDSIYLLSIKGNKYIKYLPNQVGVTEYDPEVQKVEFDKLDFTSNDVHSIVLMQKQPPRMKPVDTTWHSGQTLAFPIEMFVQDPDSIKNDITASSTDIKVTVNGNMVYVMAPVNFVGTTTFTLTGTHDWLDRTQTYTMKVIPPEVFIPNGFTPNNDGLNDVLKPVFMGKLLYCHFTVFNRYGQKVFETTDCLSGWNGRINGVEQNTGTFVYYLTYRFEETNEAEKNAKGTFTLIR
jgi:gliding motility-associated-like protein